MPKSECLLLPNIREIDKVGDGPHLPEQIMFAPSLEYVFQLICDVEVVFDGVLTAARNNGDIFDTGSHCFLNDVLDQGLVNEREHFFGLGLGCGKKSSPQ